MKKTLIATLVAASALTTFGVASAAVNTSGFAGQGNGFYVGGNLGYGNANWKDTAGTGTALSGKTFADKDGLVWGLEAGYMFNTNVGVEADYDFFENTTVNNSDGTQYGKIKNQNYPGLLAVFNLPINSTWTTFAKLGATYLNPKIDPNSGTNTNISIWAPTVAAGVGYMFNNSFGVNTQVKYIVQQKNVETDAGQVTPNYLAVTAGVTYKF